MQGPDGQEAGDQANGRAGSGARPGDVGLDGGPDGGPDRHDRATMAPNRTTEEPSTLPGLDEPAEVEAKQEADPTSAPDEPTCIHDRNGLLESVRRNRPKRDRHLLVCMYGTFLGRVVRLADSACSIGRSQSSDLWMPELGVSRAHARVEPDGDGYVVVDLESANGTYVNGERVSRRRLVDGDVVHLGPSVVLRYLWTEHDHERMLVNLYEASVRDPLTGAFNREHLDERLNAEVAFARRHRTEVSVAMFDLDHFKNVNDTHGHLAGDHVLTAVANLVRGGIRVEDLLGRYGGEEFVVVLRNIELPGARVVAERLRARIDSHSFDTEAGPIRVTASFGVASLACCDAMAPGALIAAADRRLLAAKRLGRNRVVATD